MTQSEHRISVTNALIFDGFNAELIEGSMLCVDGLIMEVGTKVSAPDENIDARGAL